MDKISIFYFFILLLVFISIKSGTVNIIQNDDLTSKYNDYYYLHSYRIPIKPSNCNTNSNSIFLHYLSDSFDENFDTYWESRKSKEDNFLNNVVITFEETKIIDRMVYQAPSTINETGMGYPTELKVYYKLRNPDGTLSKEDSDFLLADVIFSEKTGERVVFLFDVEIICDEIKIEWADIEPNNSNEARAAASEIMLLVPENQFANKLLFEVFNINDYSKLFINKEYNDLNAIDELDEQLKEYIDIYDNVKELINRAKDIINDKLKCEPRREFTTNQTAKINILNQYGDVNYYTKNTLKMSRGGSNRQSTGIYVYSDDIITIYVEANNGDPLPSIRFSQYIGCYNNWLSSLHKLKKGKNVLIVNKFDVSEIEVKVKPGGPIYIENTFTSDEQSQNIKIYFENGILFPLFHLNDNETQFKQILNDYVINYNKSLDTNDTFYNIMELVSVRTTITLNATYADQIYNIQGESPQLNLLNWDNITKIIYIFDGIQFEKDQPYYDKKNEYINIHIRYSQTYKKGIAAFSSDTHIGIFYLDSFRYALLSYEEIGKTLAHEIGHMIDLKDREIAEYTNLMIEEFVVQTLYKKIYNRNRFDLIHKEVSPDNIDNSLRHCYKEVCKGFFINAGTYVYPHYTWYDIESFYPGYWGKLDNLYRYNKSLTDGMTKNEAMIFFTNLIVGFDTGYHFERFGLAMDNKNPFNNSETSNKYKESMENAINEGKIKNNTIYKKFWYADTEQYFYSLNNGKGCYNNNNKDKGQDMNEIRIVNITKNIEEKIYNITFPYVDCIGHLGFEIIENGTVIGFTTGNYYIDEIEYPEDYVPRYKIMAYDRLLNYKECNIEL